MLLFFFFFKQKTAYEIRKGDWSSDVCSSDLHAGVAGEPPGRELDECAVARHATTQHGRAVPGGANRALELGDEHVEDGVLKRARDVWPVARDVVARPDRPQHGGLEP